LLRVALTGGIATGKSYVLDQLRQRGVACVDADALVRGVQTAGTEATAAIAARFGAGVLAADGSVDRAKLAPMVFGDADARRDLEAIVHPAVYRAISAALRGFERVGESIAVVDVPLLYETGAEKDFDRVIVTTCPVDMQISRLIERGLTEEEARERLAAQLPTERKIDRADFVIRTDGMFDETDRQVDTVLRALKQTRAMG
jgi:dephospho-CoA kinase